MDEEKSDNIQIVQNCINNEIKASQSSLSLYDLFKK